MPPPSPPPNIHRHHRRRLWHKTTFAIAEVAANFARFTIKPIDL